MRVTGITQISCDSHFCGMKNIEIQKRIFGERKKIDRKDREG